MTDSIQFTCPQCKHQMKWAASTAGKQAKCPSCTAAFTITDSGQSARVVQQQTSAAVASRTRQPSLKPRKSRWKFLCFTHVLTVAVTIGLMPYWKPHLEPLIPMAYRSLADEEGFGTHKLSCFKYRHLGENVHRAIQPVRLAEGDLKKNYIHLDLQNFDVREVGDLQDFIDHRLDATFDEAPVVEDEFAL